MFASPTGACRTLRAGQRLRYSQRKMGVTLPADIHTVELPTFHYMEHDPKPLEFYNRLPPIKLLYADAKGRNQGYTFASPFPIKSECLHPAQTV
jgi:hypothetical protein